MVPSGWIAPISCRMAKGVNRIEKGFLGPSGSRGGKRLSTKQPNALMLK